MGEVWLNIIIGVGASLIASLVWWFFLQLYLIGARSRIHSLFILMRDECVAFEKYIQYNDFNNALLMSRRILDKVCEAFYYIRPLTYIRCKNRLLINTLLNNIYIMAHRFTQYHIGYEGEDEKKACCEKAYQENCIVGIWKHIEYIQTLEDGHKVKYSNPNPIEFEPINSVSAQLLIDLNLNKKKTVERILGECSYFNRNEDTMAMKKNFIDLFQYSKPFCDDWSTSTAKRFSLTTKTLSRKKYEKIIENIKQKRK